jgi:Cu+-exporting ATPase
MSTASLAISGMNCASCVAHVSKSARSLPGVSNCTVNLARGRATVEFDPDQVSLTQIAGQITSAGYPAEAEQSAPGGEAHHKDHQKQDAAGWLHRAIAGLLLWLPVEIAHWVLQLTYPHWHAGHEAMNWIALITSTACLIYVGSRFYKSAFNALLHRTTNMDTLIAMGASVAYFYSLTYFVGGLCRAWPMPMGDELYFMEGSALLALISLGHWLEANARRSAGSAIRELMNLSPVMAARLVENKDERRTSNVELRTSNKVQAAPETSSSLQSSTFDVQRSTFDLKTEDVPVSEIARNDRVLLRPGDRIPVDGIVINGSSSIDESMVTGEPLPVTRIKGDKVIAGTMNVDGALVIRATAVGADTALSHIIAMVEKAQDSRPPVQKLADQIAGIFVPVVLGIALITGLGWFAWGASHHWLTSVTLAHMAKTVCSVLLIACPCALGLAVPAAIMVGTGSGARRGILVRDIDALQNAEKIDTVVLDKTGTITTGKPTVTRIQSNGMDETQLLRLAAAAERFSSHPLAKAIVNEAKARSIDLPQPTQFNNRAGYGVTAEVEGRQLIVGNQAMLDLPLATATPSPGSPGEGGGEGLFERATASEIRNHPHPNPLPVYRERGPEIGDVESSNLKSQISNFKSQISEPAASAKPQAAGSIVYIAEKKSDGTQLLGHIEIADTIKPDSIADIDRLRKMGMHLVLLTGDNLAAAKAIAEQVGITEIHADVRPGDKAAVIENLSKTRRVAMVGDGINDAPALATAHLGIALGSGSDVAKETGGIVLVGSSLAGVADSILLSRATMRIIRQNLFLAFIYNVLAIPLAAFGLVNPAIAAAAMALSDVSVLGNSLRLSVVSRPLPVVKNRADQGVLQPTTDN